MSKKKEKMEVEEEEEEEEESGEIDNAKVLEKYKYAATATNTALTTVLKEIVPGKKVFDICLVGDKALKEAATAIPIKTKDKGLAFPCSISVNNTACHYSPLKDEEKPVVLKEGDLVKVDLGVQVDGYISVTAHTTIATSSLNKQQQEERQMSSQQHIMPARLHCVC